MPALTTEQVLLEEAIAIHGRAMLKDLTEDQIEKIRSGSPVDQSPKNALYQALNSLGSSALCLSGGGIRSAAFALGLVQAVATHPRPVRGKEVDQDKRVGAAEQSLLATFQYLSTVSGGGYIGGWLSAWLSRDTAGNASNWKTVWEALVGARGDPDHEPQQISWLRRYSNFLTPKLGVASADSWAALALVLRNLLLNWFVIVPVICLVVLLLKLFAIGVAWFSKLLPGTCEVWFWLLIAIGGILLVLALRFITQERPTRGPSQADQGQFLRKDWLLTLLASVSFTLAIASTCGETYAKEHLAKSGTLVATGLLWIGMAGAVLYAIGWALAFPRCRRFVEGAGDLLLWTFSGFLFGVMVALGVYAYFKIPDAGFWPYAPKEILLIVSAVPWILASRLLAEMIFVGLSSYQDGSDADREWLGRAAGWFIVTAIGWLLAMSLVYVGSVIIADVYGQVAAWIAGGGAGAVVAWLGSSRHSPAQGQAKGATGVSANVALAIAAPVLAAALVILASNLLDKAMFGQSLLDVAAFRGRVPERGYPAWPGGWSVPFAIAITLVIGGIASWAVNINRFSLHALYRNRLIRAFLGASNPTATRRPNPFTDFDEDDNIRVSSLWPHETRPNVWPAVGPANWRPFHIVNIALNIVSTRNLAWQERKAEPFTVSPLHCGSGCVGYRYSTTYGDRQGMSLGTAVAVSGAAASPNMGYHSSPPLALLLTLFNVRLGWWLGNPGAPGENTYWRDGPKIAVFPLIDEMFGLTTDTNDYVYLSDGGHFENLGLYEMVRRRCRCIVVSDAGCDPDYGFEDLGNAVRKIALDLGVSIQMHELEQLKPRPKSGPDIGPVSPYYVVGEIDYPNADGSTEKGYLLYIKAGYHGIESAGVRAYALANAAFPHQSTGDQFFSESQFESYRTLGFEIMDSVLGQAARNCAKISEAKTETLDAGKLRDLLRALDPGIVKKAEDASAAAQSKTPSKPLDESDLKVLYSLFNRPPDEAK